MLHTADSFFHGPDGSFDDSDVGIFGTNMKFDWRNGKLQIPYVEFIITMDGVYHKSSGLVSMKNCFQTANDRAFGSIFARLH